MSILNARVGTKRQKSTPTRLRVFADAWPPSSAYQSPQAVQRLSSTSMLHLVDRVQMLREGRSANQRVPMHESCYSKLGAAVNKLIPQMTSSTGTKVVVDHPAIDALRRWML